VDVLHRAHQWLRPDGLVLDLHPEPEFIDVEVVLTHGSAVALGQIDTTSLIANIHTARAALVSAEQGGWYRRERSVLIDFASHFSTVDEWLQYRAERRSTSVLDPAIVARARELLSGTGHEVRVTERILATRLRRTGVA
jgi:hypothetical protein